jgi:nicotinamide mononucleotide transporter
MAINCSLTGLEFLSVLFNTIFVIGIANQKIWAWLSGFIGCFLAVFLFFFDALYAEAALNIFYSGLAIYGWLRWRNTSNAPKLRRLKKDFRISIDQVSSIPLILIFALILGYMMDLSTNNPLPYTDCVIAALSILATIWQAQKIIENWFVWMFVNGSTIFLFLNRGFEIYSCYSFLLLIMSFWGYQKWRKEIIEI